MRELGGDADLAQEPLAAQAGREIGPQDLDGYVTVVALVARQVHGRHTPGPELALQRVAVGEGRAEAIEGVAHDDSMRGFNLERYEAAPRPGQRVPTAPQDGRRARSPCRTRAYRRWSGTPNGYSLSMGACR